MATRPPDPPAKHKLADLWRRGRLTLRYHGPRELARRLVTFPLRGTRFGGRLRSYGPEEARAQAWYRAEGRPVTVVVPSEKDARRVRSTVRHGRMRIVVGDGPAAAADASDDVVLLASGVVPQRGWIERLQYGAYRQPEIAIATPKVLRPDGAIGSAGLQYDVRTGRFGHRHEGAPASRPEANINVPVIGANDACVYLKRALLDGGQDGVVDLSLAAWERGLRSYYLPAATVRADSTTPAPDAGPRRAFFDGREVRTSGGHLRVVYVTEDTGVGGGHRDIFEHLNRLAERGHEVELFSLGDHPDWFPLQVPTRTFGDYGELVDALEPLDAIKIATWWNTAAPVWLASVRRGVPVFFVQDIETSYYPDSADMRSHVLAAYRPEFHYMTISGWNRDRLTELGLDAELVPPGLDLETFHPLPEVRRRGDMLLALGRSNPLKNLPLTLDAWRALGGPGSGPELCLFGIEPELGPRHGARYVERPSDEGVNRLLNEAAVFVQTSTHEGFCLPPLEAMATGGAVVCTDAHGNRDFCADGVNCLMPEPTVESVTGAIRRLLEDPDLRVRLGRAGLETAAGYVWERRIDELEGFLGHVADHRSVALRV